MPDTTADPPQLLRYASDLARLYTRSKEDRRRRAELERRLEQVSTACVGLARALSFEDAAERLARAAVDQLGLERAAVYVFRKDRPVLAGRFPVDATFPSSAAVTRLDVDALAGEADQLAAAPWAQLTGGETAVVPLLGRRRPIGFVAARGPLPLDAGTIERWTLALLAGQAGVVLENHLLETVRGDRSSGPVAPARPGTHPLLGQSPPMKRILALAARLAHVDSPVLIRGETGTGKALFARALHDGGPRARGPFIVVNCGAIPDTLVESELFGHEAGAFTGAMKLHKGRIEQAQGGTLFLDEIGELPLATQVKLLTFLEDRRFTRVGGEEELTCDVRIVSATNRDLEQAVTARTFRADLLWRLNVFTVEQPPLRDRGADVLTIARALGQEVATRYALPTPTMSLAAEARLLAYAWPGNVRELRNVIEKAVILSEGGAIAPEVLPVGDSTPSVAVERDDADDADDADDSDDSGPVVVAAEGEDPTASFTDAKNRMLERWEMTFFQALLRRTGGNVARAAREAHVDKKHLHRKLRRYGIDAGALRGGEESA